MQCLKVLVFLSILVSISNASNGYILTSQDKKISHKELLYEVKDYPVIFMGDHHNKLKTHEFFYLFLEGLVSHGYRIHLANEWFTPSNNILLQKYIDNKITAKELREKRHWDEEISTRWTLVEKLYALVKKSKGGLYGINLTNEKRTKISLKLFENMNQDEKHFFDMLDLNNTMHKYRVMPMFRHCKYMPQVGSEPCEERMYRVQVAWDTYMAKQSAKLTLDVLKTEKDKLIIFAGSFHVDREIGIPLRFEKLSDVDFFIISNKVLRKENNSTTIKNIKADAVFVYR